MTDVQRIYLKDLPEFERNGWKADRDAEGKILIMHAPTGPQCYVARPVAQSPVGRTDWMAGVLEGD